jgi:predicted nucleic acid-binding protein
MSKEDLRSLALTRAAVERLVGEWSRHVPLVRRNIAVMRRAGSCAERYLARWEALLAAGPEALAATALADSGEAQVLRSVHPFAGILSPRERWAVLARFATGATQPAVRA